MLFGKWQTLIHRPWHNVWEVGTNKDEISIPSLRLNLIHWPFLKLYSETPKVSNRDKTVIKVYIRVKLFPNYHYFRDYNNNIVNSIQQLFSHPPLLSFRHSRWRSVPVTVVFNVPLVVSPISSRTQVDLRRNEILFIYRHIHIYTMKCLSSFVDLSSRK